MDNYIMRCEQCGKLFRCTEMYKTNKGIIYKTDCNDEFVAKHGEYHCLFCAGKIEKIIRTEPWIAHLLFTIKGKNKKSK